MHTFTAARFTIVGTVETTQMCKTNQTGLFIKRNEVLLRATMWTIGNSRRGSAETNLSSIHEDTSSILGLDQWVADVAWVWCCCGVGQGLQLGIDPWPGNLRMLQVRP